MDSLKLDPKELFGDNVEFIATDQIKGMYTYLQSVRKWEWSSSTYRTSLSDPLSLVSLQLDWNEPWLYYLILFHLSLFVIIIWTRRLTSIQSAIFLTLRKLQPYLSTDYVLTFIHWYSLPVILVYEAEDLNEYLSKNHKYVTLWYAFSFR